MRALLTALAAMFVAGSAGAAPPAQMELWRLDCGTAVVNDLDIFSDTFAYAGKTKRITDSCYLIRHGENYLLWDAGLPGALLGKTVNSGPFTMSLSTRIVDQLARIGVKPEQVTLVGISHRHDDHTGQLTDFAKATLFIGAGDFEAMKKGESAALIAPWTKTGAKLELLTGDKDVFGDGSVVMLATPGHTENHHSLLVRLPKTGPVLLTGDLYHFTENRTTRGVPSFNTSRADTLASMDRFEAIVKRLKAKVVIQHEPDDIAKLPAFPQSAQ
ncbi:MAG: N-acyl homoserine lactonase family protein [Alphaproteobacteria bacterium]|nr:MAG: N-acyl homoserine lactonase family protein [Alphaproteobacteria bacterium]